MSAQFFGRTTQIRPYRFQCKCDKFVARKSLKFKPFAVYISVMMDALDAITRMSLTRKKLDANNEIPRI